MKSKFNYITQDYFSNNIKFMGILLLLSGLVTFASNSYIISLILLIACYVIFTTKYGIEINLEKNVYLDYITIFGFKKGKNIKFQSIEYLYMTKGKKTITMQLRAVKNTITLDEYNGYIKFSRDNKIHLFSSTKKKKAECLLRQMSNDLNTTFEDYTQEN